MLANCDIVEKVGRSSTDKSFAADEAVADGKAFAVGNVELSFSTYDPPCIIAE